MLSFCVIFREGGPSFCAFPRNCIKCIPRQSAMEGVAESDARPGYEYVSSCPGTHSLLCQTHGQTRTNNRKSVKRQRLLPAQRETSREPRQSANPTRQIIPRSCARLTRPQLSYAYRRICPSTLCTERNNPNYTVVRIQNFLAQSARKLPENADLTS